ncbi:uncharacterized protein ABDE67_004944 [Symphorus nematophorus]
MSVVTECPIQNTTFDIHQDKTRVAGNASDCIFCDNQSDAFEGLTCHDHVTAFTHKISKKPPNKRQCQDDCVLRYTASPSSRIFQVKDNKNITYLTIWSTVQEDEGMYHCAVMDWSKITWSGTYLSLKGNTERTSNLTVVQRPTVSDPVHPGDLMTLQCSVLSDSENKTCAGDHSVFWFRAGSDKSHPNIIYTDGNRRDECNKKSDTQKSCVYRFSKNVAASDAGTYYCAVATCGEILFGNGTNLQTTETASFEFIALVITIVCLVISMIGNIVLICCRTPRAVCEQCKAPRRCRQTRACVRWGAAPQNFIPLSYSQHHRA